MKGSLLDFLLTADVKWYPPTDSRLSRETEEGIPVILKRYQPTHSRVSRENEDALRGINIREPCYSKTSSGRDGYLPSAMSAKAESALQDALQSLRSGHTP